MKHKRGDRITDFIQAAYLIEKGRSLFHEKTVMCTGQLKTRSISWMLERVKAGKLYHCKPEVSLAVGRWIDIERHLVLEAG